MRAEQKLRFCRGPENLDALASEVELFLTRHDEEGLVISFLDIFPKQMGKDKRCRRWREVFDYGRTTRHWQQGYAHLDRWMERADEALKSLLESHYHDCAFVFWQAEVLAHALDEVECPTFYLLPIEFSAAVPKLEKTRFQRLGIAKQISMGMPGMLLRAAEKEWRHLLSFLGPRFSHGLFASGNAAVNLSSFLRGLFILFSLPIRFALYRLSRIFRSGNDVPTALSSRMAQSRHERLSRLHTLINKNVVSAGSGASGVVVMTIEDSGTGVNLGPAQHILEEFGRRGQRVLTVTGSPCVYQTLGAQGNVVLLVGNTPTDHIRTLVKCWPLFFRLTGGQNIKSANLPDAIFSDWLASRLVGFSARSLKVYEVLDDVKTVLPVAAVLSIYEVLPLSICAGKWALRQRRPWIGFFPILVGDRPDGHHFPAPEHLVYGEQLRDLIASDGHPALSTFVVGTPTYDAFFGRDAAIDRAYCDTTFSGSRQRKLIVVATEAFPDPLVELDPVLRVLGTMEGVHVVVKVHPSDPLDFFANYVNELPHHRNIDVVAICDLGALLHTADLLICIISNIIISAAILGTPTLVCDFSNKRRTIDFVTEGLCRGCFDPAEIRTIIERLLFDPKEQERTREMLAYGVRRFNGPNDGRSVQRIVDHVIRRAADCN